ncbi:hypothetical protein AB3Z07_27775 (plasmid) [Metabacillus halosaccharovorans]|uniref:hypothetical protein n=1 Tax=Metabacillus halosaccharovorans TaxID=930124 RepID=UPI0020424879|nr:hypothetical protein [Metabacillus halosaccharovorans]MCM3441361.1 hypothetical protein [Metabacillus halosaccharovorans]
MYFAKYLMLSSIAFLLSACTEDELVKKALEMKEEQAKEIIAAENEEKMVTEKQRQILEDLKKPLNDVLKDNELEKQDILAAGSTITAKESYSDPTEFARLTGRMLFDFNSSSISPEEYYTFLEKYASKQVHEDLLKDKNNAIMIFENIQNILNEQKMNNTKYALTQVTLNQNGKEAYFYRKVSSDNENQYYVTTLVLEDDVWKYDSDEPSMPFEEDNEKIN